MRISLRKYGTIGKSFVENCSQIVCSDFATNIGMVSPGTHLVKNHESQSMPVRISPTSKKQCPKLKMLFCLYVKIQTVNLKTDSKTLYYMTVQYTEIYLESFYFNINAQQRLNESLN